MNKSRAKTPKSPIIDTIISISDHERNVSLMLKLKYSLNIQKPESFTCENIRLPAPKAITIKFGLTADCSTIGIITVAAVSAAIVADPIHILMIAAINQPRIRG